VLLAALAAAYVTWASGTVRRDLDRPAVTTRALRARGPGRRGARAFRPTAILV